MRAAPFDLGLCEADAEALRDAKRRAFPLDREAALGLVARASALVDAAVRRRPLFTGVPFELPEPAERPEAAGPEATGPGDRT